jgi:hypothetical protein
LVGVKEIDIEGVIDVVTEGVGVFDTELPKQPHCSQDSASITLTQYPVKLSNSYGNVKENELDDV